MTNLQEIMDLMMPLIPNDYRSEMANDIDLAKRGTYEMAVALKFPSFRITEESSSDVNDEGEVIEVTEYFASQELTFEQIYLAAHFAYRAYLMKLKDSFTRDAINFSTLTFSIKGLEKRPEMINDSLYQLNRYLENEVAKVSGARSILGTAVMYGGE